MKKYIAERKLLYSLKGSNSRKELIIRISAPYIVDESMVGHPVEEGVAGCSVEFEGLFEECSNVYGTDLLQALHLAVNIEPTLQRLRKKYDFYWPSGESYFDDED